MLVSIYSASVFQRSEMLLQKQEEDNYVWYGDSSQTDKNLNRLIRVQTVEEQQMNDLSVLCEGGILMNAPCLILKVFSDNSRPFTSVSTLGSALALQPGSALLLQPPQLRLALPQLPLQKLQLLLVFERSAQINLRVTNFNINR